MGISKRKKSNCGKNRNAFPTKKIFCKMNKKMKTKKKNKLLLLRRIFKSGLFRVYLADLHFDFVDLFGIYVLFNFNFIILFHMKMRQSGHLIFPCLSDEFTFRFDLIVFCDFAVYCYDFW